MRKIVTPILCTLFITVFFNSCSYGLMQGFYRKMPVEERAKEIKIIDSGLNIPSDSEYCFIVTADLHFGAEKKADIDMFFSQIAAMPQKPAFMIAIGDMAEHGLETEYEEYYEKIILPLEDMGIKTFNTVGNHDLYNHGWNNYTKICYPYTSFYKFTINDLSYYFIDSASGNLSKPQKPLLEKEIKNDPNKKMIFTHVPLYGEDIFYFIMQDTQERNELISLFENNNVAYYVAGHDHRYRQYVYNNFTEISIPAFRDFGGWGIFTVNQQKGTITFEPLLHQISAS